MDDPQRRPYRREPTGTVHRLSDCGRGVRPRLRYSRSLPERTEASASVGEPAEGSLKNRPVFLKWVLFPNRVYIPLLLWQAAS